MKITIQLPVHRLNSYFQFVPKTESTTASKEDADINEPVNPQALESAYSAQMTAEERREYEEFFKAASLEDLVEMADILGLTYQVGILD